MTDPRLMSVHLESAPRRDDFRRARSRVQGALGEHTLAGDLQLIQGDDRDRTPGPSGQALAVCWLFDRGRQISLKVGLNSVGRLPDNDVVIDDATRDPRTASPQHLAIHAAMMTRAVMVLPLIKGGRLAAYLYVLCKNPRAWTDAEVQLVAEVADRTWSAVERARAEMALQESEARLRALPRTWLLSLKQALSER